MKGKILLPSPLYIMGGGKDRKEYLYFDDCQAIIVDLNVKTKVIITTLITK